MRTKLLFAGCAIVLAAAAAGVQIRTIDGNVLMFFGKSGAVNVLFFVATDCPISNSYAPEIQHVCAAFGTRGVRCTLVYDDPDVTPEMVRKHEQEYRYREIPAVIDDRRKLAKHAGASITPQAVVLSGAGDVRYRGRIDNLYAGLGKPRQQVTEHDVSDALDAVLAGKPVAHPETKTFGCYIVDPKILRK